MKKLFLYALLVSLTSCAAIEGIFKAGFWVGAIIIVCIVLMLFFIFGKKKE